MVLTEKEEEFVRLGIQLFKTQRILQLKQNERRSFNEANIDSLQSEIKIIEEQINSKIEI